jgi:hypothetical protein
MACWAPLVTFAANGTADDSGGWWQDRGYLRTAKSMLPSPDRDSMVSAGRESGTPSGQLDDKPQCHEHGRR